VTANDVPVSLADDVVRRAQQGDVDAFERLYRAHAPAVHALARRMLGNDGAAREMVQDVFVRAWEKLALFRGESSFGTWLHRLAVNVVIERRRSYAIQRERISDDESAIERAAVVRPGRGDLALDFEQALASLPDGAREVFVLHDVEGYKHREIAAMLDITSGTSKRQLHRARLLMRKRLV